jgi:hypothetical protein
MSLFEYIVGMLSIIVALAVAQLFVGVAELMQRRARVRFFWPHGIWVVNLFMITFIHWWSLWTFRDLQWNFAMFFYSLLGPSLMFFAATMLNPRDRSSETIDVMAHFLNIRQFFLSVFMIMLVLFTFDGPLFGTEELFNALRAAQIFLFAMAAWGLTTESPRVQLAISVAVLAGVSAVAIIRFLPG